MKSSECSTGFSFLGDDSFPSRIYSMNPYSRQGLLIKDQKLFNYHLSRGRHIVENAFGILVAKSRVFG
jgi:hypothetical protein